MKIVNLADDDAVTVPLTKMPSTDLMEYCYPQAGDGNDPLLKIAEDSADVSILAILDMNMPKRNGFEVLQVLRSDLRTRSNPSVMLSTTSNKQLIKAAYEYGVNAYIPKPISIGGYDRFAEAIVKCFLDPPYWYSIASVNDAANLVCPRQSKS